jgi:protein-S-isoprenylcysteine O-methyltransferase Ste14
MQPEVGMMHRPDVASPRATGRGVSLKALIGSGDRIALFTVPIALVVLALWAMDQSRFAVDGTAPVARAITLAILAVGLVGWAWSAVLILTRVPKGELITSGPFAVVKHPLYTSVGLLVLPAIGILIGTWLGLVIGLTLYVGARLFAPAEERDLRGRFGVRWDAYEQRVLLPWL